jgi:hypothetical protein
MKPPNITKSTNTFVHEYKLFTKNRKLQCYLEKMFDTKFQTVWVDDMEYCVNRKELNVGSIHIIIILKNNGRILELTNSEWGSFGYLN